jgi:hypothetical protein
MEEEDFQKRAELACELIRSFGGVRHSCTERPRAGGFASTEAGVWCYNLDERDEKVKG